MKKICLLLLALACFFIQAPINASKIGCCTINSCLSNEAILFSGNSNLALGAQVANYLKVPLGHAIISKFNDGEIQISIKDSVRNKNVFILQSTCCSDAQSVNDSLMELFLLVRTIKRSSSASITAVIPYYAYARQDRKTTGRVPISASDIALMLELAGVDRVVTIDLHCGQIQGFFHYAPVDNLFASYLFASYFADKNLENITVVSPDAGGVERAKKFTEHLALKGVEADMALISKQRAQAGVVASMVLIGDVKGRTAIIIDDLCDTGGTIIKAAELLKQEGASQVFVAVTHPVFSGNALEKIGNSTIDEMVVTDTIPLKGDAPANIRCISIADLLGEAIFRIQNGDSLSDLFPE